MADKDLRRLGRTEMLEMLIEVTKERDALESRVAKLDKQVEEAWALYDDKNAKDSAIGDQMTQMNEALEAEKRRYEEAQEEIRQARQQAAAAQQAMEAEKARADSLEAALNEEKRTLAAAQEKINAMTRQLEDRIIIKEKAGTLAEAAMYINGVFEAAQKAADQYLTSVEHMHDDLEGKCDAIIGESRIKAEKMIQDAEQRCAMMEEQTRRRCEEMKVNADKNVWQKWSSLSEQLQQISAEIRSSVSAPENGEAETH